MKFYFSNLDTIRFFAFFLVFLQHTLMLPVSNYINETETLPAVLKALLYTIFMSGGLGVSIFLTLSGFLITYLIILEVEQKGKLDLKAFYVRRTLRIWPLYFLVFLILFILFPIIGIGSQYFDWRYFATFTSNFNLIQLGNTAVTKEFSYFAYAITWSLSVEEQFYLFWPLLFLIVPKRYYVFIFIFFIVAGIAYRIQHRTELNRIYLHTLAVMCDLAIGALGAYAMTNYHKFSNWIKNLKPIPVAFAYIGVFLLIVSQAYLYKELKKDDTPSYFFHIYAVSRLFISTGICFVILSQCFSLKPPVHFGRLNFARNLGKYTYGLYLLHVFAIYIVNYFFKNFGVHYLLETVFAFLLSIVLAYLSFNYFEKPFLNLKAKFQKVN